MVVAESVHLKGSGSEYVIWKSKHCIARLEARLEHAEGVPKTQKFEYTKYKVLKLTAGF